MSKLSITNSSLEVYSCMTGIYHHAHLLVWLQNSAKIHDSEIVSRLNIWKLNGWTDHCLCRAILIFDEFGIVSITLKLFKLHMSTQINNYIHDNHKNGGNGAYNQRWAKWGFWKTYYLEFWLCPTCSAIQQASIFVQSFFMLTCYDWLNLYGKWLATSELGKL